jgi:hypothetical protein
MRMTQTVTATATTTAAPAAGKSFGLPIHSVCALWVGAMLFLASRNPSFYDALMQEDRFVEWLTAAFFLAAGATRSVHAIRHRRFFDLLVGAFCIFVGGEEMSWGQRLLGFTPPDVFLEHNTQQEFTLHNFADIFGKPKGILIIALLGYALVWPLLVRSRRLGASTVGRHVAIWLMIAAVLLLWYPVDLTGEWVEALAGFLFLVSAPLPLTTRSIAGAVAVVCAGVLTLVSMRVASGGEAALHCARTQTRAILADITSGLAASPDLLHRNIHKRIYTAVHDGYIGNEWPRYDATACSNEGRHHYLVDPWGMAYWVQSRANGDVVRITVYSFGPNRNRDAHDIKAITEVPRPAD